MKKILEKYSKYLPSKKFTYFIMIFFSLCLIAFLAFNFSTQKKFFFFSEKKTGLQSGTSTINDVLQKDTDDDGVLDWEETLWGTDKNNKTTFNGIPDLVYIENKKKDLNVEDTAKNNQELTETEKFAREFFATYVAMKTSGTDANTINNFADALGQKITYPSLIDSYSEKDVKVTTDDNDDEKIKYYSSLKELFDKYQTKGIGSELPLVANEITSTNTTKKGNDLPTIANAYQGFAKKMMEISVPQSFIQSHLSIANASNNTGVSIMSMTKISTDPIVGLSGLSQYQEYNNEFVQALQDVLIKIKSIEGVELTE
jgi:hypothetical protein